jgi:hypothetical protein
MARQTGFKIPGLTEWVDRVKNVTAQETAEIIVYTLQIEGPAYTGEFRNAWVALPTPNGRIPAAQQSKYTTPLDRMTTPTEPREDIEVKPLKGNLPKAGYTIGNKMEYRDIALDLDPNKVRTTPPKEGNTADPDWYLKFAQGQGPNTLTWCLQAGANRATKNPTVRGFNPGSRATRF